LRAASIDGKLDTIILDKLTPHFQILEKEGLITVVRGHASVDFGKSHVANMVEVTMSVLPKYYDMADEVMKAM
jgi:hypothetical protein